MLLSSCSSTPADTVPPLQVTTTPVARPAPILPTVDVISTRPVQWIVITRDTADAVFERLEATGEPIALFALTDEGYENLSLNISDIRQLVQQQRAVIIAYENYVNN
jgi:hypothetical protein